MKLSDLIKAARATMVIHGDIDVITDKGWEVTAIVGAPITSQESAEWDIDSGEIFARIQTSE